MSTIRAFSHDRRRTAAPLAAAAVAAAVLGLASPAAAQPIDQPAPTTIAAPAPSAVPLKPTIDAVNGTILSISDSGKKAIVPFSYTCDAEAGAVVSATVTQATVPAGIIGIVVVVGHGSQHVPCTGEKELAEVTVTTNSGTFTSLQRAVGVLSISGNAVPIARGFRIA